MRRVDGAKVTRLTPGDLPLCPCGLVAPRGAARERQKSAEAIVAAMQRSEGPNTRSRYGTTHSRRERDADERAEMPERSRRGGGGTAEDTGVARQARPACGESAGTETALLMEEVLRRENVMAAHKRVVQNGGAPGVDGMTVEALLPYCREHWARIREALLSGTAYNGRGPWWNAGASHMHTALPTWQLHRQGLVSLLAEHRRLACVS
jgi:hypothetical protein